MKMPNVKSKKFIISTVVSVALLTSAGFAAATMVPNTTPTVKTTQAKVIDAPAKTEIPTKVVESTPEVIAPAPEPAPTPPPAPVVLSTQQYAEQYLNLADVIPGLSGQMCLDALVATYPERFTEDVRERNVKALSIYASPCGTGYGSTVTIKKAWDYKYPNGSFFDSEIAKSKW